MKDTERRLLEFQYSKLNGKNGRTLEKDIIQLAYNLNQQSYLNLRTIVDALAEFCFKNYKTLDDEFLEKFKSSLIAEILVKGFKDQLSEKALPKADEKSAELIAAREDLKEFLHDYAKDTGKTVDTWMQIARLQYPGVNFHQLFDQEIVNLWVEQINLAAANITEGKFKALFSNDQRHFILDFLFKRVFRKEGLQYFVTDKDSLKRLIRFLDAQQFNLEELYELLCEEFDKMSDINAARNIAAARKETREDVQKAAPEIEIARQTPHFLKADFDFDDFFNREFTPLIKSIRAEKLPPKDKLRSCDVTRVSPEGLAQAIYPYVALKPLVDRANQIRQSEEAFIQECRKYFNYMHPSRGEITDEQVKKTLGGQLRMVKKQIQYIIRESLENRDQDDPIRKDCQFIKEIIDCESIDKIFIWVANPSQFLIEYPQYAGVPFNVIIHQARTMIMMLLFYRKNIFDEKFKSRHIKRALLEEHFMKMLNIKNKTEKNITFRVAVELDKTTRQPLLVVNGKGKPIPKYHIIRDKTRLKKDGDREIETEFGGGLYRLYPCETKKFQEISVEIPNSKGEPYKTRILVYSGDGSLIHAKPAESYLSSLLRGKEPTDLLRWGIVTYTKEDNDALRDFLYEYYSTGYFESIKDNHEDRSLSQKRSTKQRTKGSEVIDGARGFLGSMYAMIPQENENGEIEHKNVQFETQIYDFDAMMIYFLSNYTVSSHNKVYRPEREFSNLFKYLFPPIIYGKKFAEYKRRGYKKGKT